MDVKSDIKVITTQDGSHSLYSEQFGENYHSKYGAIQESLHVFIQAGLFYKFAMQDHVSVLGIGFGSGLNAFLTYLETFKREKSVYYEGVEAYPVPLEEAAKLNFPELLQSKDQKYIFDQMHQCEWDKDHQLNERFLFRKSLNRFENINVKEKFDVVFFDAFAPSTQPELWESPVLSLMYDALKPGGVFVTYSAKGSVKRNLKGLGFTLENLPGPPGKREMIRAIK